MNIIILGAGEVGEMLCHTLRGDNNNITIVDSDSDTLDKIKTRLDVMTIRGECANYAVLKRAGIERADLLVAVTGNDAANILACRIAKHFNVERSICRISTEGFFDVEDGFTPGELGVDVPIYAEDECVSRIASVLRHECILEKVHFSVPGARLIGIRVPSHSPVVGVRLKDFPDKELIEKVRFSAILRSRKLIAPRGDTILSGGDEVYIAGAREDIFSAIDLIAPDSRALKRVVVAGASRIGANLVSELLRHGHQVTVVDSDHDVCGRLLERLTENIMAICGDPTDAEVLEEANVGGCDAFVSVLPDDEDSILCCVLAKQMGADKVVAVAKKLEYRDIIPAMSAIDCGFNLSLMTVNSVLNNIVEKGGHVHAILQRCRAMVYEIEVHPGAPICGRRIMEYERKWPAIISLVIRNYEVVPASGAFEFKAGDRVAIIADPETYRKVSGLFAPKGLFDL